MWTDDPSRDQRPGHMPRSAALCSLLLFVACSNSDKPGTPGAPQAVEGGGQEVVDPSSGAEAPSQDDVDAALPETLEELVEALGAIPADLKVVTDPSLLEPTDPAAWPAPSSVGGDPVRILREVHPTTGTLLRIAAARPVKAEGEVPVLHGPEWRFHESGATRSIQWWKDDVPHGPMKQWRPVGMLAREGVFSDGQRDGLWRAFAKNGQLIEQKIYRNGLPEGEHRAWYPTGEAKELETYKGGVLDGPRKQWGRGGLLVLTEVYEAGSLNGRWSDFFPGTSKPRQWGEYRNGKREGTWRRASETGVTLSTATYINGVLDGLIRLWSEEGVLIEETTYSEGQKTGPSLSWYADGTPQSEGRLENGRRIGRWTYWKSDGALNERWSGVFEDDERVSPLESEGGAPRPPQEGPR